MAEETPALAATDTAPEIATIEGIAAPALTEVNASPPGVEEVVEPVLAAPVVQATVDEVVAVAPITDIASAYNVPQSYDFAPSSVPAQPEEAAADFAVNAPVVLSRPEIGLESALRPKLRPEIETSPLRTALAAEADVTLPILGAQPSVEATATDPQPVVDATVPEAPAPVGVDPALLEIFDLPQVLSGWTVEIPADVIGDGGSVFAVNGVEVASLEEIDSIMSKTFAAPFGPTTEVEVLSGATRSDAQTQTISAQVLHRTLFLNGLFFETRLVDGTWMTEVITAPDIKDIGFQTGDVIVGDLATGTPFDKRTSMPDLLTLAQAQNRDVLTLAVRRDGQVLTSFA